MTEIPSKIKERNPKKADDKKAKASYPKMPLALLLIGGLTLLTTPLIYKLLFIILTLDCPIKHYGVECGLDKGLDNAEIVIVSLSLWLCIGIGFLIAGLLKYFNARKKR
jgi:hypothetical protein